MSEKTVDVVNVTAPQGHWFFVFENNDKKPVVQKIALWATLRNGDVVGMVAANSSLSVASAGATQRLALVPPINGQYKPEFELTAAERNSYGLPVGLTMDSILCSQGTL